MSTPGAQVAVAHPPGLSAGEGLMAQLLHAVNQPLTGLQCSMELALTGQKPLEQYVRTLTDGLELVSQMRVLVEAMREVSDLRATTHEQGSVTLLDDLLRQALSELEPVAEASRVQLRWAISGPLLVRGSSRTLMDVVFRTIESAISMSRERSTMETGASAERNEAVCTISAIADHRTESTPFSRSELGFLVAQATWKHLGGTCDLVRAGENLRLSIRLPLVPPVVAGGQR